VGRGHNKWVVVVVGDGGRTSVWERIGIDRTRRLG